MIASIYEGITMKQRNRMTVGALLFINAAVVFLVVAGYPYVLRIIDNTTDQEALSATSLFHEYSEKQDAVNNISYELYQSNDAALQLVDSFMGHGDGYQKEYLSDRQLNDITNANQSIREYLVSMETVSTSDHDIRYNSRLQEAVSEYLEVQAALLDHLSESKSGNLDKYTNNLAYGYSHAYLVLNSFCEVNQYYMFNSFLDIEISQSEVMSGRNGLFQAILYLLMLFEFVMLYITYYVHVRSNRQSKPWPADV